MNIRCIWNQVKTDEIELKCLISSPVLFVIALNLVYISEIYIDLYTDNDKIVCQTS